MTEHERKVMADVERALTPHPSEVDALLRLLAELTTALAMRGAEPEATAEASRLLDEMEAAGARNMRAAAAREADAYGEECRVMFETRPEGGAKPDVAQGAWLAAAQVAGKIRALPLPGEAAPDDKPLWRPVEAGAGWRVSPAVLCIPAKDMEPVSPEEAAGRVWEFVPADRPRHTCAARRTQFRAAGEVCPDCDGDAPAVVAREGGGS